MSPRPAPLSELAGYLDTLLRTAEIPDSPNALNGLQVENRGKIGHLVAAVDASQAAIDHAATRDRSGEGGVLLLAHHGLFWDGNVPVTGRRYRRLQALLAADVALYAAHIPLDVHPVYGNNAVLAQQLGLEVQGWWGEHRGIPIGVWGEMARPRAAICQTLDALLQTRSRLIPGGPERTGRVGIITGAGGSAIAEARAAGIDTFITGEGAHHTWFDAMELGLNVVYAGHYATETVGVQALAEHLAAEFRLTWEFFRQDTGM